MFQTFSIDKCQSATIKLGRPKQTILLCFRIFDDFKITHNTCLSFWLSAFPSLKLFISLSVFSPLPSSLPSLRLLSLFFPSPSFSLISPFLSFSFHGDMVDLSLCNELQPSLELFSMYSLPRGEYICSLKNVILRWNSAYKLKVFLPYQFESQILLN